MDYIRVDINLQKLQIINNHKVIQEFEVSTAKNGLGENSGSECTPKGWHKIRAKIGANKPIYSVFVGRRITGEIYTSELALQYPNRDWILSRILWLGGLEAHKNRYGMVDSTWRYIYIHGSPDHLLQGKPESHGCIRMKNSDIVQLFDKVTTQTKVYIQA